MLEKHGIKVVVSDQPDRIGDIPGADVYGITCTTPTYREVCRLTKALKNETNSIVVVGGVHASVLPERTLQDTGCDRVLVGESEYSFLHLCNRAGSLRSCKVEHPIISVPPLNDLDALPFPARHLFPFDHVVDVSGIHGQEPGERATTMITSRGCPYHCSYCCKVPQTAVVRYRSPENVVQEVQSVQYEFGVHHLRFVDDVFTLSRERTMRLCGLLKPLEITWACITRADLIDSVMLEAMKDAGCKEVHIGVESFSQRILDLMNKNIKVGTIVKGIEKIKRAGLICKVYLMYGFPSETDADVAITKKYFEQVKPHRFTLSKFALLPGSDLWYAPPVWFYPDDDYPEYAELKQWLGGNI